MTGDIDYAEAKVSQRKFCKPQIDGDAPQFLFRQPICVHTGQGLNERSLAMIDVARRAELDQVDHATYYSAVEFGGECRSIPPGIPLYRMARYIVG